MKDWDGDVIYNIMKAMRLFPAAADFNFIEVQFGNLSKITFSVILRNISTLVLPEA